MAIWDDVIAPEELEIYAIAGYASPTGFGKSPALLVIDVEYNFLGERPEPIRKSMKVFPNSCGEEGWHAIPHIQGLLAIARQKGVPVVYTHGRGSAAMKAEPGRESASDSRATGEDVTATLGRQIVKEIAPRSGELVIEKDKASAFWGTSLISYLVANRVDTVLVTGCTTSGCVRATVVDSSSYGFKTVVIQEAVFDRAPTPHKVNLFDMNAKYADVVSYDEGERWLSSLS